MSTQDLDPRAREFLAVEYERDGKAGAAEHIRTQPLLPNKARAVRAVAAALRQQSAPVDLVQFREAVECWRDAALPANDVEAERKAEADRLLSIIDSAGKAAQQPAPVVDDAVLIDGRRNIDESCSP